jgi:aldehyde dehydrogenase (NAD+)
MVTTAEQKSIQEIYLSQKAFFKTGVTKEVSWRIKQLKKIGKIIEENEAAILDALYQDLRKNKYESLSLEIGPVYAELKHLLSHIKDWVEPETVGTALFHIPGNSTIYKEPFGNVLLISPWNYPFLLTLSPLLGAISAGNCIVVKPSENSPNTSKLLVNLINKNFDPGFVYCMEGGVELTQELLAKRWDYIFFTGGTEIGRIIYQAAAKHLTPVTLELGGKSPCIIDETADIKLAAKRVAWGKWINAGQTCIAPDYVYVHKSVQEKFIDQLKRSVADMYSNAPLQSKDYCKIINQRQYDRLKGYLTQVEILYGGKYDDTEQKIEPTILYNPPKDSSVMTEEIFGPILPIYTYENIDDVIAFINEREKPLAAYIFSKSSKTREKFLNETSSGGVCLNDTVLHISSNEMPFGGVGESGIGGYHGKSSFDTFTHHKSVLHRYPHYLDPYLRYAPYSPKKFGLMRFFLRKFL